MINHTQLMDALSEQTAALEAAISLHEWDKAVIIMKKRLELLEILSQSKPETHGEREYLKEFSKNLQVTEQKLASILLVHREELGERLHELKTANRATQAYQKNR